MIFFCLVTMFLVFLLQLLPKATPLMMGLKLTPPFQNNNWVYTKRHLPLQIINQSKSLVAEKPIPNKLVGWRITLYQG